MSDETTHDCEDYAVFDEQLAAADKLPAAQLAAGPESAGVRTPATARLATKAPAQRMLHECSGRSRNHKVIELGRENHKVDERGRI